MSKCPKIAVPIGKEIYFLDPDDLLYCIEEGGYAHLILHNEKRFILQRQLEVLVQNLPDYFLQIHPSYLVNIHHLAKYLKNGSGKVIMSDGEKLPVSKGRKKLLLRYFQML